MKTEIKINRFKIYWESHQDHKEKGTEDNCPIAEIIANTKEEAMGIWNNHILKFSPRSFLRNSTYFAVRF